jgi:hypothetical protein
MSSKSYDNITEAIFDCVKAASARAHNTVYDPPDADQGTATSPTPVGGHVVLTFNLDTTTNVLSYDIKSKPFLVTDSEIWDGISSTIKGCT